jgi:hypothetical protein
MRERRLERLGADRGPGTPRDQTGARPTPAGDRGWLEVLEGLSQRDGDQPPTAERRTHPRTRVAVPTAAARLPRKGEGANDALIFVPGTARDVGAGGLSFSCPGLDVQPDDLVSIFLAPPGAGRRVQATCLVLRVSGLWVAAQFVDLDERAQLELSRFVRRYGQRPSALDTASEAWGVDERVDP